MTRSMFFWVLTFFATTLMANTIPFQGKIRSYDVALDWRYQSRLSFADESGQLWMMSLHRSAKEHGPGVPFQMLSPGEVRQVSLFPFPSRLLGHYVLTEQGDLFLSRERTNGSFGLWEKVSSSVIDFQVLSDINGRVYVLAFKEGGAESYVDCSDGSCREGRPASSEVLPVQRGRTKQVRLAFDIIRFDLDSEGKLFYLFIRR